jgi:tRNA threonylcarbamoyladenosine biosynthesis protein TsaB
LAIASRVPHEISQFTAVLDAGRGELFVADFRRLSAERLVGAETTRIVGRQQWLAGLSTGQVVTGPGLSRLLGQLPPGARVVDEALWAPTAVSVGRIGHGMFLAGNRAGVFDLVPQYFRRTAAEEQWDAKGK